MRRLTKLILIFGILALIGALVATTLGNESANTNSMSFRTVAKTTTVTASFDNALIGYQAPATVTTTSAVQVDSGTTVTVTQTETLTVSQSGGEGGDGDGS